MSWKFGCVTAIALLAMGTAGPSFAQGLGGQMPGTWDGFIAGSVGGANFSETDTGAPFEFYFPDFSGLSAEAASSFEYNLTDHLGVQGDAVARYWNHKAPVVPPYGASYGSTDHIYDFAAHGFYRNTSGLFGVFGQVSHDTQHNYALGEYYSDTPDDIYDTVYLGVEGQLFVGDATFYGQLAHAHQTHGDETGSADGWVGRGEIRYFLQPDFKVNAHLQYGTLSDNGSDGSQTATIAGLGAEYRFSGSPISLTADADFIKYKFDWGGGDGYTQSGTRVLIGLKFNFGSQTLEARDRTGASLSPLEPLFEGDAHAAFSDP